MMKLPEALRRVRCPACDWQAVWGAEEMLQMLRQRGALRREADPELTLIVQLIEEAAPRLSCLNCRHTGLTLERWTPDFDDEPLRRRCEICREWIPDERLDVFPQATRCATCQDRPAPATAESDFCPRCGGHVQVRLAGGAGISRYRATCTQCGWQQ